MEPIITTYSVDGYTIYIKYCYDFTVDGMNDVLLFIEDTDPSDPIADTLGLAVDIQGDATSDLFFHFVGDEDGTAGTGRIDANAISVSWVETGTVLPVSDGYDLAGRIDYENSADSLVMIISSDSDLSAETLLEGSSLFFTWSDEAGTHSYEMTIGDLESCGCDVPEPGMGNTPGFWKNHQAIFEGETGLLFADSYEELFGVDVEGSRKLSDDPTLQEALSARGGGEAALLRASTAAMANASSDDVNFSYFDAGFDAGTTALLEGIDMNDDFILSSSEIVSAVQSAFDGDLDMRGLADALDMMNNMPSVEADAFIF
ncbi:hypothetical protein [Marimonas lutisalis]|uniref:hypothetical protein n=1 Tax=Marimonas lutisalis TaxID=2545756 RepID=UPI0010F79967|nr:hypothetical protein [Marimonas lutisalis]